MHYKGGSNSTSPFILERTVKRSARAGAEGSAGLGTQPMEIFVKYGFKKFSILGAVGEFFF